MNQLSGYYAAAVEMFGPVRLALMAVLVVALAVQLYYYLGLFRRLPSFRMAGGKKSRAAGESISVVLAMGDDYLWIENSLPLFLTQDYSRFEMIVVYVGNNNDFAETLEAISVSEPRFRVSRVRQHPLFPISNKMALNIGIKAAVGDNIVVTTPGTKPVSPRWLSLMAKGFERSEVVIGYCGIASGRGLADKVIRSSRMFSSLMYLTAAIRHKPYRGTIHNMGFSRDLYFRHKGFGHLNLNLGEDDLFMQQLFEQENYTIVMHPRATMRQTAWGGLGWWLHQCRLRNHAWPFYPRRARWFVATETVSRLVFYASAIALSVMGPMEIWIGVGAVAALRLLAVILQMRRVAVRLGEKHLMGLYVINDVVEPLAAIGVVVSRIVKPIREVWR